MESLDNQIEIIKRECRRPPIICSGLATAVRLPSHHISPHILISLRERCAFVVNEQTGQFESKPNLTFKHDYPATKIMFIPDKECNHPDILATCGDYLRLWKIGEEEVTLQKMLNNVSMGSGDYLDSFIGVSDKSYYGVKQTKNSEFCAPLTSFDWNEADPKQLGTSSIDTTCTIWDIEVKGDRLRLRLSPLGLFVLYIVLCISRSRAGATGLLTTHLIPVLLSCHETSLHQRGVVDTQLIAHDKEVYDIAWGGQGVFASVSADGSVRVFDLRYIPHSGYFTCRHYCALPAAWA